MVTQIEEDGYLILSNLAEYVEEDEEKRGRYSLNGDELKALGNLTVERVNDAVEFLEENGHVELLRTFGTAPYTFRDVELTSRGRYEYQRLTSQFPIEQELNQAGSGLASPIVSRSPVPVGSPYGFTDQDWEFIDSERKLDELKVVFGLEFESTTYDTKRLVDNIKGHFQTALDQYVQEPGHPAVELSFKQLSGGYGEHLFNEIVRDIISADIAVFDTSDVNPNVMIELGVALTWGTRVLPIFATGKKKPPTDISGHTWVVYENDGAQFAAPRFQANLVSMIKRAMQKKGSV